MADYDSRKRKPPEYPRKGTIHMKKRTNTNPMRRLLSLALSIVMVLSLLPAGALAEEPVSVEAVTLEEGDGVMALTARLLSEGEELAVTPDMK